MQLLISPIVLLGRRTAVWIFHGLHCATCTNRGQTYDSLYFPAGNYLPAVEQVDVCLRVKQVDKFNVARLLGNKFLSSSWSMRPSTESSITYWNVPAGYARAVVSLRYHIPPTLSNSFGGQTNGSLNFPWLALCNLHCYDFHYLEICPYFIVVPGSCTAMGKNWISIILLSMSSVVRVFLSKSYFVLSSGSS